MNYTRITLEVVVKEEEAEIFTQALNDWLDLVEDQQTVFSNTITDMPVPPPENAEEIAAPIQMPEIPPEAWMLLDMAHRAAEKLSSADPLAIQGNVNTPGSRTAAGVQRVQEHRAWRAAEGSE
jgi:hypothetical protein